MNEKIIWLLLSAAVLTASLIEKATAQPAVKSQGCFVNRWVVQSKDPKYNSSVNLWLTNVGSKLTCIIDSRNPVHSYYKVQERVACSFSVNKNGAVSNVHVTNACNDLENDKKACRLINYAAPFYKPPVDFPFDKEITVLFTPDVVSVAIN